MKRPIAAFVVLLWCGWGVSQEPAGGGFVEELTRGFDQWDADRDGKLSHVEIERQIADPKVQGRSAAALAAMQTFPNLSGNQRQPMPRDFIVRESSAETARVVRPAFDVRYRDGLARIEQTQRVLFGPGAPTLDGLRQGHLGDCYFVAVVGAVTARDPGAVRNWLESQPDQFVRVRFPLGSTAKVAPLTDGEIALTSFAGPQGMWINTLEKGFGTVMRAVFPASQFGIAIDSIASGGNPVQTIRLLTANEAFIEVIRRTPGDSPMSDPEVAEASRRLGTILADCRKKNRIAIAGSPARGLPPGMDPTHAYAVLGFEKDLVTLWNPHGKSHQPAGDPGVQHGYPTEKGRFTMPLTDFVRVFAFLAFESEIALRVNVNDADPKNPRRK